MLLPLSPEHLQELRASGITDEVIHQSRIYSLHDGDDAAKLLNWSAPVKKAHLPALVYPYGANYYRLKFAKPIERGANKPKYESPRGADTKIYFPPGVSDALADTSQTLIVTEGEKKSLSAVSHGFPCIGLPGDHYVERAED